MAAKSPNPKLGKSQALNIAQNTSSRLATFVPTLTTELSPATIYQPGASGGVGNELLATPDVSGFPVTISASYGVWIAPDVNGNGTTWYATVECFGGGGGGGGGNHTQGGGGGGGGEYACETQYPITPGASYAYAVGLPGAGGFSNNNSMVNPGSAGTAGSTSAFDIAGLGLAGGVVAHGGGGGDATSVGIGGIGGTGSSNSIHYNGGTGGTNVSGNGSDNPISLAQVSGMFTGNTLNSDIILDWLIFNDSNFTSATRNDASGNGNTGTWTNFTGGNFGTTDTNDAPAQVPAYTSVAGTYGPNQTTQGFASEFNFKTQNAAARFTSAAAVSGVRTTFSGWIQAPPQNIWGNTANGAYALIWSNCKGYTVAQHGKGQALYFQLINGVWELNFYCGNGTIGQVLNYSAGLAATNGTWYYVVCTYNSGTMTMYINGSSVGTASAGFTFQGAGAYGLTLGCDPSVVGNWFFGLVSNFWWANDSATSTLVSQAFGLTAPTGGAGGGASGGPNATGGTGTTGSGATGGAGGTPATRPASIANVQSQAMGGYAGSNAGSGNASPATPSGGSVGGGGGGSGDMSSPPGTVVLTIPFSTAATYCGVDAGANAGNPYNTNQQANPNSGINSVLYSGGLAADISSGSKNSMLLFPKGLQQQVGSGSWTIQNVFLTFTNAFPNNPVESILEIGYAPDTTLPQTYSAADFGIYVGAAPIPSGAGTITYDLSSGDLPTVMASGAAGCLIIGPGATPTFDAYNAATGPQFYCSIYGPGAYDTFGNPLYPYLTVVLQKTVSTQQGSNGAGGGILITNVDDQFGGPVAFIQPFATTDVAGNQSAAGYTGNVTAFNPSSLIPGSYIPETWHKASLASGWAASGNGYNGFWYRLNPDGFVEAVFDLSGTSVNTGSTVISTIPTAYQPAVATNAGPCAVYGGTPTGGISPYIEPNGANITYRNQGQSAAASFAITGYVRWWPAISGSL